MIDISAPRYVAAWIGATPDTAVPPRIKLRIYLKQKGLCSCCGRPLQPKKWDCDHTLAIVNGGTNEEANLRAVCNVPCHREKTKQDVATKAKTYRMRARHIGLKRKTSRPIPGSKASGWKHTMSGQWVRRSWPAEDGS